MIAVDANLLVYAHRRDASFHARAVDVVRSLAEGSTPWGIPWPCVHEFLAIVTHPRIFRTPSPLDAAIAQVSAWRESPALRFLAEEDGYWEVLCRIATVARVAGAKLHDARIAAIARQHEVTELLSADRDFSRFADLRVRNPL